MAENGPQAKKQKKMKNKPEVEETDVAEAAGPSAEQPQAAQFPPTFSLSEIKNKQRRQFMFMRLKQEKRKEKLALRKKRKKERAALGDKAPPKPVPKTIENQRVYDETTVDPADEEVALDEAIDEFAPYFNKQTTPKILITTSDRPRGRTVRFTEQLSSVIPNSDVYYRRGLALKKVIPQCISRDYTDLIIINEDRKVPSILYNVPDSTISLSCLKPYYELMGGPDQILGCKEYLLETFFLSLRILDGLVFCHLPDGPTAHFKMSNVRLRKEMKRKGKEPTEHKPEVILNNFTTRLGHSIGRMFASLYPHDPQFTGRQVATFHNQRDYIFFRYHRYIFKSEKKVGIQELGPRFTLKLRSLQKGTFDSKYGEYEWVHKRHEMDTSRRKFHL
uniref:Ribosome production factor 1 n=1 Tax=Xenopus tropicalis TaxID=8364 RepID=A0A7D9N0E3_XENTR